MTATEEAEAPKLIPTTVDMVADGSRCREECSVVVVLK